ncbi:hypothetical protein GRI58_04635 [Porphyrobacter algicida]|uniref:Ribbon-helix-helix protein, CopG family n=1 Tax=Qipengyuania algicida TaxID=1836209 RepID=A0A845AM75_9SPHN|nr:ribbon-helix-helix domain-containing protein [Qipengyuania algicida]MXP28108.1 hypothetical protein [Qipengyuania algicida]
MTQSTHGTTKNRRASQAGKSINVRLQPDQLARLDDWIEEDGGRFTRPEAIRTLLNHAWGLTNGAKGIKPAPDRVPPAPD